MSVEDMNNFIYSDSYYKALSYTRDFVQKNSGTPDDANDVFQDAVLFFCERSIRGEILEEADAASIFCQIARNTWLDELRKRKKSKLIFNLQDDIEDFSESELQLKKEKEVILELIEEKIHKLKETCRNILQSRLNGESFESLAGKMEIKDIRKIWMRYHRCKNKLIKKINRNKEMANKINDFLDHG